jgi:hypothetical protein
VLAWLAAAHRLSRAWPILLATTVVTAATGALLWQALMSRRTCAGSAATISTS